LSSLVIFLVLLALPATPSAADICGAGSFIRQELDQGGVRRSYHTYAPKGLGSNPKPLVVMLHGSGGSGPKSADCGASESYINTIADQEKFLVVYPDGIGGSWNTCGPDSGATDQADDVGFVKSVIAEVSAAHEVNLKKVYVIGVSAGGMLASRFARHAADQVAGIGMIVAAERVDTLGECGAPSQPISVVVMNGDADRFVPYHGGCVWGDCKKYGAVQSTAATIAFWKAANGMTTAVPETFVYPDINPRDRVRISRQLYGGGTAGPKVALFHSSGGGHAGPSTAQKCLPKFICDVIVGPQNWDIEGLAEMWALLKTAER
jgi:polyhydroxybutyrate depolymerase